MNTPYTTTENGKKNEPMLQKAPLFDEGKPQSIRAARTVDSSCSYCEFTQVVLRVHPGRIVLMLVLLIWGVMGVRGATIDFNLPNGYYFLGNQAGNNGVPEYVSSTFEANYYMCPAYGTVNDKNYLGGDETKPLITTFKSFPNNGKTYLHAIWYIEAATGDDAGYFYIKHYESGKYMVANDNTAPGATRRRVNLGPTTKSDAGNDGMFKIQSDDSGSTFYIYSKTKKDGDNKYLSPSGGNKDFLYGTSDNSNTGGILGFWKEKDKNSAWHFIAQAIIPEPTITFTQASFTYTGEEIEPGVSVNSGAVPSSEYEVTYSNNTNAGIATASITNKPGGSYYVFDGSENFTIAPKEVELTWGITSFEYNGSSQQPVATATGLIGEDVCTVTVGGGQTDVGDYTATATGLSNANYALPVATTQAFSITAKEVGLAWGATTLEYNGSPQHPTATATGLMGEDVCTVTVSGGQTDIGIYTATATGLSNANYSLPSANTQTFTIIPKSLGSGSTPAENITCDLTETDGNYSIVVKQGGNNLTQGTDYIKSSESGVSEGKYYEVTVAGTGNYKDGFSVKLAKIHLSKLTGNLDPGGAALFASNDGDGNFVVPENMKAYIVTGIEGNTLVTEELDNIPNHVPVLLVLTEDANSFLVQPEASATPPTGTNLLKEVTNTSQHFDTAEIYLLYKGEFVLNMEGDLAKGKIYLDKSGGPSPAPVKLYIDWDLMDGIDLGNEELRIKNEEFATDKNWYTLDGRRLDNSKVQNSKMPKGVYIVNGKKVIIR